MTPYYIFTWWKLLASLKFSSVDCRGTSVFVASCWKLKKFSFVPKDLATLELISLPQWSENSFQEEDCHFLTAHWTYVWVHNRSNMPMFCLKNSFLSPGWSQIRHLWPKWPSPDALACLNLNLTQGHPLVAKFSNKCNFRHFLRVFRPNFRGEFLYMYGSQKKIWAKKSMLNFSR